MQPIVDGLEGEFSQRIAFEKVDADTDEGQTLLRLYGLRGHPSYVIVDTTGSRLWRSSGQTSESALRNQIKQYAN